MTKRLENKTIIVTGSSRGIGKACAIQCAKNGANVVIHGRSVTDAFKNTITEIEASGAKVIGVTGDVSSKTDVEKIVKEVVEKFGKIDGLINNAGVAHFSSFLEISEEDWERTMAINAKGPFLMTQAVAKTMISTKIAGRICNVTSISGEKATSPMQVAYCSSKGAANMFTKIAALALAEYKITVNAILPGTIETDINRDVLADEKITKSIINATPLKCLGDTDDVAYATVYFMSDESKWVTGTLMAIDGGFII
jgi:NAD(P)-dependent dehydrogenase (short-subunit alcohol dehydrogenase family)